MNLNHARSTKRCESIGTILQSVECDASLGINESLLALIASQHPIPSFYMKQDNSGKKTLLGSYSHVLLNTCKAFIETEESVREIRRVSGYFVNVIVIEFNEHQDLLIETYVNAGLIV